MTDIPDIQRPSQLWKQLTPERKLQSAEAFFRDENALAEQAEAIYAIAARIKFRAKSVIAMPAEKKAKHLTALAGVSELVAARLLVAYHLQHQRPMMASFLDALGVAHENGLIADEALETPPAAERVRSAAESLGASFPSADVSVYLSTLIWQDPATWGALTDFVKVPAVQTS